MGKMKIAIYSLILSTLVFCFIPAVEANAAITSVDDPSYVESQTQNSTKSSDEQLSVEISGSIMNINGKTTLPVDALDEKGYRGIYLATFMNRTTKTNANVYVPLNFTKGNNEDGTLVYSFSGSVDIANSGIIDGDYLLYVWRARTKAGSYKFGKAEGKGILSYDTPFRVKSGIPGILKYNAILGENQAIDERMNSLGTDPFIDPSLKDIFFVNRDPRIKTDRGSALTSDQVNYIREFTKRLTASAGDDQYKKIKIIYGYAADNMYYDTVSAKSESTRSSFSNPYYNLKNILEKTNNGYNSSNGRVASECTGYSSMVAAMARSIGIPARLVKGVHPAIESIQWPQVGRLNKENHHWTECFVDGRWIMVDATMGTQNKYDANTGTWTRTGISNYTFFDPTDEQVAVHYLKLGQYEPHNPVLTKKPYIKTAARTPSSISVKWTGITGFPGLGGYYVRCYSARGQKLSEMHVSPAAIRYTFKGLTSSRTYKIQICAYGFGSNGKIYGPSKLLTSCTVPKRISQKTPYSGRRYITTHWYKAPASGYNVRIASNSKFTKGVKSYYLSSKHSSKKITNLSKGKYYFVKVRAYKTLNGAKYFGSWSKTKYRMCR